MITTRCDCCGRMTPDIHLVAETKKYFWRRFSDDSQGGSYRRLDICDSCWKEIGKAVSRKEQSNE